MKNNNNTLKLFIGVMLLAVILTSCEKPVKEAPEKENEMASLSISETEIYTTAHGTDLKLSQSGTVTFSEFQQPLETEASILVNKDRLHQTIVLK